MVGKQAQAFGGGKNAPPYARDSSLTPSEEQPLYDITLQQS